MKTLRLTLVLLAALSVSACAGDLTIQWQYPGTNTDGTVSDDLNGYKILYGTAPTNYTQSVTVTNPVAPNALGSHKLTGLTKGTTYFLTVAVFNRDGGESDIGDEVSAKVKSKPGKARAITVRSP